MTLIELAMTNPNMWAIKAATDWLKEIARTADLRIKVIYA